MAADTVSPLASVLAESRQRPVVWVSAADYGRRLFTHGEDIWADPGWFIELTRQVQQLLASEVIEVPLDGFHRAAVAAFPSLAEPLRGRRPAFALRRLLADRGPTGRAVECVSALKTLYPATPVVITLGAASEWLRWAAGLTGAAEVPAGPDEVETASTYLADVLRSFSVAGLSAVVVDVRSSDAAHVPDTVRLHRALFNVASHHSWMSGVTVGPGGLESAASCAVDFVLCPDVAMSRITESAEDGTPRVGGGLDEAFWRGQPIGDPQPGLWYGQVPEDAEPEVVLESLKRLRGE